MTTYSVRDSRPTHISVQNGDAVLEETYFWPQRAHESRKHPFIFIVASTVRASSM